MNPFPPGWPAIRQRTLGWIFPPCCGVCDEPIPTARQLEMPFLCEECEGKWTPMGKDACRVCGQSYGDGSNAPVSGAFFRCANCADRDLAIDFAISAYRSAGVAREVMHAFKYGKQIHLARLFGALLQRVWEDPRLSEVEGWHLVPVPLHRKRFRERGFNQSREIALEFASQSCAGIRIALSPWLRRVEDTVRQAQLDRKDRLRNLSSAFSLRSGAARPVDGCGILIVDDVMTTATTVSECARVLRRELAEEVPVAAISALRG